MSEPAVVVDHASKRFRLYTERNNTLKGSFLRRRRVKYEEFWALDDVSLEVPEGASFALIGENGSGKSTLLKCMARIYAPDSGSITTRGKLSALLELGAGFHQELSGRDNVYLNGSILGMSRRDIDNRFDEIVGFAGLEEFIDVPVKNYSSGMYVRLGFSVAISVEPDILLVDEVLAVGDAEFQLRCLEKVDELRKAGKTIIIVTHALGSVRHLCDQAALIEHGKLQMVGPAPEVIDAYIGEVLTDHHADGAEGARWGSGEARITDVEVVHAVDAGAAPLRTGDRVIFRLHYEASEPIERPVFGLAIHRLDGAEVTGPNSREAGAVPDKIEGRGYVELEVERLMLVPGTYDLSVSLYNYTLAHPYDFRQHCTRFDIEAGTPFAEFGVMSMGGEWHVPGVDH